MCLFIWITSETICSSSLELLTNLPDRPEAHKMQIDLGKQSAVSAKHIATPAPSITPSALYTTYHRHTHILPRLSDLYALSFEWHKCLSSLGLCTQPEHTYMAADGNAGRFHGHPSEPTGNAYQHTRLTSAKIKASIKKINNTNWGEVTSSQSRVIKAVVWLAAFSQ